MEESFISLVFEQVCLWDKKSADFKNVIKKRMLWEEIARKCNLANGDEAEALFKSFRSKYVREKRKDKDEYRSGAAATVPKNPWHLKHLLSFLDDQIVSRRTFSSAKPTKSDWCQEIREMEEQITFEEEEMGTPLTSGTSSIIEDEIIEMELTPLVVDNSSALTPKQKNVEEIQTPLAVGNGWALTPKQKNLEEIQTQSKINKNKRKKMEDTTRIECHQLSELAAALAAPINIQGLKAANDDDGIPDKQTRSFCQYLGVRLCNLPVERRRIFERKILDDLSDLENALL